MSNDPLKVWWSRIWSSELPLASLFRNLAWNQTHLLFASYESPAVATTTYRSSVLLKASLPVVFLQECLYEEKTPSNSVRMLNQRWRCINAIYWRTFELEVACSAISCRKLELKSTIFNDTSDIRFATSAQFLWFFGIAAKSSKIQW